MLNCRPSILFLSTGDATRSRMAGAFYSLCTDGPAPLKLGQEARFGGRRPRKEPTEASNLAHRTAPSVPHEIPTRKSVPRWTTNKMGTGGLAQRPNKTRTEKNRH